MSDEPKDEADDAGLRDSMAASGFKPNADGVRWAAARPKVLVAGAYKVIRTAAEKARDLAGRGR
ncbi:MAG: hypothetical protein JO089_02520 [Alphaproteobacteria bacterium]|nr:hypothetical protein [Alphaproteobacteria bacterium]